MKFEPDAEIGQKGAFCKGLYELWIHNGRNSTGQTPVEFAKQVERLGAGEIVINSIDNDGVMKGYNFDLVHKVRDAINLPITVLGGARIASGH